MDIKLLSIKVGELVDGYKDCQDEGVTGYKSRLDIRPPYQREFVYKDKQRDAVIHTVRKGFPLGVMYWVTDGEGYYEVLDGQQRTLSICQYVNGDYSMNHQFFHNLTKEEQDDILNYELLIYICEGEEREKLDWFTVINIAGEKLTRQELRNSVYTGPWLSDAKALFSKNNCSAYQVGKDHITGTPNRQDFLETALDWISDGNIETYMSSHQHDTNANELWNYFDKVMAWAKILFPQVQKEMKSVQWGHLYNKFKDKQFNPFELAEKVKALYKDDEVTKKAGIYNYLLTGEEKHLNTRTFSKNQIAEAFTKQDGHCLSCGEVFELKDMHADHILPWSKGGKTHPDNLQMLCRKCNLEKSDK